MKIPIAHDLPKAIGVEVAPNIEEMTFFVKKTIRGLIQDLNSECCNYENKNGRIDTIIKRMRVKYNFLKRTLEANLYLLNDEIIESYNNVMMRGHNIIVKYQKEGGQQ